MFKKTITYQDFNKKPHTEDFYFNMMVPEVADLNFNPTFGEGDLSDYMRSTMVGGDNRKIYTFFKLVVVNSYGRRSEDGATFRKRAEWTEEFLDSPAWEQLFLWLTDPKDSGTNSAAFWNGIFPESIMSQVKEIEKSSPQLDVTKLSREELQALYVKTLAEKRTAE